jgi:hypothetical protein
MEEFIHQTNMKLYRQQLSEAQDEETRQMLVRLLREEQAKDQTQVQHGKVVSD